MSNNILARQTFTLGVEEDWDSYYEVEARFARQATIAGEMHYVFLAAGKEYWLTPRYVGQSLESVMGGRELIVNVSVPATALDHADGASIKPVGTGVIRIRDR